MEQKNTAHELETKFSGMLRRHLERLAGPTLPAVDFPIDVATLACSVLLREREAQLKGNESTKRFTHEDLLLEISELGVPMNGNLEEILRMLEKEGYVRVQEGGYLQGETRLIQFCNVLDKIFPRMPGLNLVAYLVQTMEEVLSGRKGLDDANRQLDQVLEMHGVPLSGIPEDHGGMMLRPHSSKNEVSHKKVERKREVEKKNRKIMLELLQAAARQESKKGSFSTSKVIRPEMIVANKNNGKQMDSSGDPHSEKDPGADLQVEPHFEKEGVNALPESGEDNLRATDQGNPEEVAHMNADNAAGDGETREIPTDELPAVPHEPDKVSAPEAIEAYDDLWAGQGEKAEGEEDGEREAGDAFPDVGKQEGMLSDEAIEERIAAFEEELAMACPLCGRGRIEVRETAKGKRFYECSRDGCYFISWGKPYHLSCPKCQNNFLIEAVDAAGKVFLKCPRTTCNYRQNLPGEDGPLEETKERGQDASKEKLVRKPKKKVVRRRVVRRKK